MPASQNDLHRMLGEILGKVGAVERQIDEIKEGIEASNDRADRSRADSSSRSVGARTLSPPHALPERSRPWSAHQ